MEYLRIYESPFPKIRLGKPNDGGYVICDLSGYDLFLSAGVADDISFEESFLEKYHLACIAYDGNVDKLPVHNSRIVFIKKNIGIEENETSTNLKHYFKTYNNIFLKMDIEGAEVDWISCLDDSDILKIKQLTLEFHSAYKIEPLKRLAKTHWLVHVHPNNCCGTTVINGVEVPNFYECTYIRKDLCENLPFNKVPIPTILDQPNVITMKLHDGNTYFFPEIYLNHAPFVDEHRYTRRI